MHGLPDVKQYHSVKSSTLQYGKRERLPTAQLQYSVACELYASMRRSKYYSCLWKLHFGLRSYTASCLCMPVPASCHAAYFATIMRTNSS